MYNTSPLFHKHLKYDRFFDAISITSSQDQMLLTARKKVRQAIKIAFAEAREFLKDDRSIQERDIEWISLIKPKFMTQGSYAYKTLNSPCHQSQEIDLDDGVYLPMSIIESIPEEYIGWFFSIVDGALRRLADQEGWVFTDGKDTCARVTIPNRQAHIDVPLYAISDKGHEQLNESLNALNIIGRKLSDVIYDGDLRAMEPYILDENEVYLATRKNGWKPSDPMLIANWFKQQVSLKTERLRRICRFLKSWRDFVWEKGGPSSLTLMICAVEAYPDDDLGRDDHALLAIAKALPNLLNTNVFNPASMGDEIVYPRGDIDMRNVTEHASILANTLSAALSGAHDKLGVINDLTRLFGNRIPCNPEWIEKIKNAAIIRSTSAVKVTPQRIPNVRSA